MEAAGASGKQWYQQGQGDDKFQHVRAIMGARPSMMVSIPVDLVSVMPVIMSVIMPAMPPRTILCMIMGLVTGKPHAPKSDQPGHFGQQDECQDQQPVFCSPGSS